MKGVLQEYALTELNGKDWRRQKTTTIRISPANLMSNTSKLREAVTEANEFMCALYPASVPNAFANEHRRLESLDPRIEIDMTASEREAHCRLRAKESVKLQLSFEGREPHLSDKMDMLWNRGLPTSFGPGEIEVSGSALMERVFSNPGVLQIANRIEAALRISAIGSTADEVAAVDFQMGIVESSPKECRFSGNLAGEIIRLNLTLPFDSSSPNQTIVFTFTVNFQSWVGRPILHLPYFSQCYSLFHAISDGARPKLNLSSLGNEIFEGFMHTDKMVEFENIE